MAEAAPTPREKEDDEDDEVRELRAQFEQLAARATTDNMSSLQDPEALFPFYNRFMTLAMELDRRIGTKKLLLECVQLY